MASRTLSDGPGERDTLLQQKDATVKIDILPKQQGDDGAQATEAAACQRLIKARKSLTRAQPINETFDYNPAQGAVDPIKPSLSAAAIAAEAELSDADSVCSVATLTRAHRTSEEEATLDNMSASLSALPMEKFALEKRRVSRILPRCLHPTFVDPDVENLFQVYHERQRRGDMHLSFMAGVMLGLCAALLPAYNAYPNLNLVPVCLFLAFAGLHLVFLVLMQLKLLPEFGWMISPFVVWLLNTIGLITMCRYNETDIAPRQTILWMLLIVHLVVASLPLRSGVVLLMSVITSVLYLIFSSLSLLPQERLIHILGCIVLGSGSIILSLMSYFFADKKHRRAFLETRQSLEVKMVIEEQSKEQERLLLSVLPKHVAETMRQDLGRGIVGQFKKIYMSRHENVSILFADIVGFTAISSTYTASELVKMLNELFARFDGLADKYKQLRIKILGDCYYCISGAPKERPDHAILSVHMGLSMIDAIKYVRETTGCTVDMRVGIHTGAVLAGVLGQRQWQFDVYSKDVILANKMESSGKPGRVHVSNTTLQFLNNHFEVEPAYGEKREDSLKAAALKTYFIAKVLIPHKPRPSLGLIKNGAKNNSTNEQSKELPSDNTMISRDSVTLSTQDESRIRSTAADQARNSFTRKLQKELVSRDGRKDLLNKLSPITLTFRDAKVEKSYRRHRETFSGAAATSLPLILFLIAIARYIFQYGSGLSLLVFLVGFLLVLSLTCVPAARSFPVPVCQCLIKVSEWMHANQLRRSLWFGMLITLSVTVVFIDICIYEVPADSHDTINHKPLPPVSMPRSVEKANITGTDRPDIVTDKPATEIWPDHVGMMSRGSNCTGSMFHSDVSKKLDYYTYYMLLILLASSLLSQMNYIFKSLMLVIITIMHCLLSMTFMAPYLLGNYFCWSNLFHIPLWQTESFSLTMQFLAETFILILISFQMEKSSRVLYMWRQEVEEQRERAEEFRQRNEALVYNILPPHVATHFMGMSRKKHEELYSQSYDEVGVLFASMPNFGDFYSEESVNNQGLECLRFLNEVISDFDNLLEKSQFCDIVKIKTIGSTYMATSGLNPSNLVKIDDPLSVRWAHLSLLVDFALELMRALQLINEQSFNHFVLRMGINSGPITAGVIGARKPHYDIWGNTVNVASRMESTGKAGCIQLTEETTNILRPFGYVFEKRGLINVKGKGELMTYYLLRKDTSQSNGSAHINNNTTIAT